MFHLPCRLAPFAVTRLLGWSVALGPGLAPRSILQASEVGRSLAEYVPLKWR
jgi:hypothetical protein